MTDHNKLRELAAKATPGQWDIRVSYDTDRKILDPENYKSPGYVDNMGIYSPLANDWPVACDEYMVFSNSATAAYIAAANPTVIIGLLDTIDALTRERDNLEKLLVDRGEYETEYAGRMYFQCVGCGMPDDRHEPGCVVASLIEKHTPKPPPYVPPNPAFNRKICSHCGKQFKQHDGAKRLRAHMKNKPDCAAVEADWIKAYDRATSTKGSTHE